VGFGPFFVSCVAGVGSFAPTHAYRFCRQSSAQEASARIALANLEKIVLDTVGALSLELVEVERAPRGLLRVFIDRPAGKGAVTVDDCQMVSNQLTHVFTVENIDYDRLEVSSPGLDRALKSLADFQRFAGRPVRVRLNQMVAARKRFSGLVTEVSDNEIVFAVTDGAETAQKTARSPSKRGPKSAATSNEAVTIRVALSQIESARLIPEI
jgi:ribosome maturation factor RimP